MSRYRVLPYKQGSRSAKALADALGGKVLKLENSKFKPKFGDIIINWGNTTVQPHLPLGYINPPTTVSVVSNKLNFFRVMQNQHADLIPKFWTNKEEIPDDAFPIVCRTILNGHSGAGIVIADTRSDLVVAPLYTQYLKKKDEYRVHVGRRSEDFEIIAIQRKARREDFPDPNWQVRNHANGFIFARSGFSTPEAVTSAATQGLRASGLDFGAVDVIWNEKEQRAYVLEVNTAPGLEGQTVTDYASFFKGVENSS